MSQLSPWTTAAQAADYFSASRIVAGNVYEVDVLSKQPMTGNAVSGAGTITHTLIFGGFSADILMKIVVQKSLGDTFVVCPVTFQIGEPNFIVAPMKSYNLATLAEVTNCSQFGGALVTVNKPEANIPENSDAVFILPAGKAVKIYNAAYAGVSVTGGGLTVESLPYRVLFDDMQP